MVETISYAGWHDCRRVTNGQVEAIVTQSVGPRILRFGFAGEENQFKEFPEQLGLTGGEEWRPYGGHRLWHAPEAMPRSYAPDNSPIEIDEMADGLRALQPMELTTGIQKEMELHLAPDQPHLRVIHRLHNLGLWPLELAPWALSVMAPGGVAVVPQPVAEPPYGLLPNRYLVLWPYTDLQDPRHHWGSRYLLLRQDPSATGPTKFGINNSHGWGAYVRKGVTFVKKFHYYEGMEYPDGGCSMECYTSAEFLELESLGPSHWLEPGDVAEHTEDWFLFRGGDASSEDAVAETVQPLVDGARTDLAD